MSIRQARAPWSRALAALTALGAVLALAACGSSNSSSTSSSSSSSSSGGGTKAKSVSLAFVYPATDENFAQEMALGAKAAAEQTPGVKFTETAPPSVNGPAEVQLFQSAVQTSNDGVAMMSLTPNLFPRPVNQAIGDGTPVIAVDAPVAGSKITTFVGNSNFQLGVDLAQEIEKKLPASASGQILIGTDTPGLPPLVGRNMGFMATIKKKYPNIKFVQFDSKQVPNDNFNSWSAEVKAHPNALAYVGPGSQDATSLAQIEKRSGKHLLVGACDLDPVALQGIKNGFVQVLISPEHWLKGYVAIKLLAAHAQQGKAIPTGWFNPGALAVTKANIDEIIARQKSPATRAAWFKKEVTQELADPSKYIKPLSAAN